MSKFKVSSSKSSILSYPTAKPELSLDFVNTPEGIDPAYTFTRNSSATYVGPDGFIKTAAVNQPRFDFDPVTGECRGLLVEEARTNLVPHSINLNSFLTSGNCFIQPNATISPDGQMNAVKIIENSGNVNQTRHNSTNFPIVNILSTLTMFLKAGERTRSAVSIGAGNALARINVDLLDGTYTTFVNTSPWWSNVTFEVIPFPNSWFKIRITGLTNRDENPIYLYPRTNSSGPNNFSSNVYQGDGISGFYCWGLQLEYGSFPTSHIPTTTSTVTRQPDQLVLNKPLSTQGTLYVESRPTSGISLIADNGSSLLSVSQNPNQYSKSILYYNTNRTLTMSSDGGVPLDFSSSSSPSNLNRVSLGFNRLSNSNYINGHLKKFSYYSSPLTEDNLRALTGNKRAVTRFPSLGEPIVTSGLVLNLDAGNPASYPGSGTTWFDLSGNGNNGTLLNGVGFDGANLGSLTFDGVNDRVDISPNNFNLSQFSVNMWFKTNNITTDYLRLIHKADTTGSTNGFLVASSQTDGKLVFVYQPNYNTGEILKKSTNFITTSTWYNITMTYNSTSGLKIYFNSIEDAGEIPTFPEVGWISNTGNLFSVGSRAGGTQQYNGNIARTLVYNRALTAQEIQQNFNALRNRFGI
jgi:hypothetical protein